MIATAFQFTGGIGVVVGYKARWSALALLIFLVPVTIVFHNFWAAPVNERQLETINFLKNLSIAGGTLIVFARGAGAFSIDEIRIRSAAKAVQPATVR